MRAVLQAALHMNSPYIDGAIADAIQQNRDEEFAFNGARTTLQTAAGVKEYPLPQDFISLRGKVYVTPAGNTDSSGRYPLKHVTLDELEETLYFGSDYGIYQESGFPRRFAIDKAGMLMLIAPVPTSGGDVLFFRYTKDVGVPRYTATTSTTSPPSLQTVFTLLGPDGQTLPSSFANAWFDQGFELIRSRALYILWTQYHSGTEEAQQASQIALQQWLEETLKQRGTASAAESIDSIRKFL